VSAIDEPRRRQFVSYMVPGFPESLFERMAEVLGADLHVDSRTSGPAPGEDPFRDGTMDLGWICSTSFVELALADADPSVRLAGVAWVPDDPDAAGRPVYFGDVVVRADSDAEGLAALTGRRIGGNDPVSLSGHHALRLALLDEGFDPETFAPIEFTGGHHASLDALAAGTLDAAVVDSVVRLGRARHDAAVADLRVVRRLGPWPTQPLVVTAAANDGEVTAIRDALLDAARRPELAAELAAAGLTGLVAVGDDHYAAVSAAMAAA